MRIVAGSAKGVRLAAVPEGVRPLSDRAREGLFSSLGEVVPGSIVVDLFAGTGAMGIEALSRGASLATFVDRSYQAMAAVHDNLERARVADRATPVLAEVGAYLAGSLRDGRADLVFLDPPYELTGAEIAPILAQLDAAWLVKADWTVVLTRGQKSSTPVIPLHWGVARELRYGDSSLTQFRPKQVSRPEP